ARSPGRARSELTPPFVSPAFVRLQFAKVPIQATSPSAGQIAALTCTSCRQYITSEFQQAVLADACTGGGIYPYVVRPRGDCVAPVAVGRTTWGRVKAFYH